MSRLPNCNCKACQAAVAKLQRPVEFNPNPMLQIQYEAERLNNWFNNPQLARSSGRGKKVVDTGF